MSNSQLIDQLFRTVEVIGYDRTDELLKNAQYGGVKFSDPNVEKVLIGVAETFKVPAHEIFYGQGRKNDRKWAIGFVVYYLNKVYQYEIEQIANAINKSTSACFKYSALVKALNPKTKLSSEKMYLEYKNNFDIIFIPQI